MQKQMRAAIDAAFKKLMAMPREEFLLSLEIEGDGDIAAILNYTGALKIREFEAEEFNTPAPEAPTYKILTYNTLASLFKKPVYVAANDLNYPRNGSVNTNKDICSVHFIDEYDIAA